MNVLICSCRGVETTQSRGRIFTIFSVLTKNYSDMIFNAFKNLLTSQQDVNKMLDTRITVLEEVLAKHFPAVYQEYQFALYNEYQKMFPEISDKIQKPDLKPLDE